MESISKWRGNGSNRAGPRLRIGVASIAQETNTWSVVPCTLDDFTCQGLALGESALEYSDTNTEFGGAIRSIRNEGCEPVPIMRAWANSSGRLTRATLDGLCDLLAQELRRVEIDGCVLSLHGAMAAEGIDDADSVVLRAARGVLGPQIPVGVCLDLHANVTEDLVSQSDFVIAYRTYPHVDLADTGARAARFLIARLRGELIPHTAMAKRGMLIPAEAMSTADGPLARVRAAADRLQVDGVLDVSLYPVQPWLDVAELGFGVTVTTDGDPELGRSVAEDVATQVWDSRRDFQVSLLSPGDAIAAARRSNIRPFLITESSDAPTAGAAGDSPAMIRAFLEEGRDLTAYVTITDPPGVERCLSAGVGRPVTLSLGCHFDKRFSEPVRLTGTVERLGDDPVVLTGPSYTGMKVSMGRFAVVRAERLHVLISERPAFTLDPASYVHAGLDPASADVVVVRSAMGFRSGFPVESVAASVVLDLPGASTPRLDLLRFSRPIYPLDPDPETVPTHSMTVSFDRLAEEHM